MPPQPDDQFHGWVSHSPTEPLTFTTFTAKPFDPTDLEIQVTHCGICGTDVHTLRSGWGPSDYPCVVGHEIVGTITRLGASVPSLPPPYSAFQIGDRVAVGAQILACLRADCDACSTNQENYCPRITGTYNDRFWDSTTFQQKTAVKTMGGFARTWRGPAQFVFRIPEELSSAHAAPLLCAGATVFTPLRKYGAGAGKHVGVVGIGGLGHLGVLFAKALGCERVVAISRSSAKRQDAVEGLGADAFIATGEEEGWAKKYERTLDLIICTVDGDDMPLARYLRLLRVGGTFVQVGAPEKPLPQLPAWSFIQKGIKLAGSNIGSREDIRAMLELAAQKNVLPWIEKRPMKEVNVALRDMDAGRARYRYVLENGEPDSKL
ncbi:NAD(P)-dependent alcohol dehydrogenase [Aspergillus brunneoviolaceus CBS 621.78]|uniref:Alcohol dehydrogenase n=1 Tax=Aspergillus brunneoviolaceus CBS 621.78 TaxID=1450534 RepID=A0ACD1GK03_9EURO|nr:putative alcohol dehydrogenase [Aspergillus brunneoviolaceus CBS 621.78]RAH49458.1 putative alcohol dehydrogenase [Aspergillus brunneoviolaceus CBS 621.78]